MQLKVFVCRVSIRLQESFPHVPLSNPINNYSSIKDRIETSLISLVIFAIFGPMYGFVLVTLTSSSKSNLNHFVSNLNHKILKK